MRADWKLGSLINEPGMRVGSRGNLQGREFRNCEIGNENLHGLYNFTTKGDMLVQARPAQRADTEKYRFSLKKKQVSSGEFRRLGLS